MDKDRRLAYLILKETEEKETWSSLAVGKSLERGTADSEAFIRELVYGVIRNKTLLDYNINRFLKKPKLGISERIWLRMGFYQLAFMSGVADYAAINETVGLARAFKKGSEGFINAVLRSFQRTQCILEVPAESDEVSYLSVKYSCHESIVRLWLRCYGREITENLLEAGNTPALLSLRVNTAKISRENLVQELQHLGFEAQASEAASTAVLAKGSGILDSELFRRGFFSVQGESSQMTVDYLDPQPGELILDLCAAPGGKSFAMAERMEGKGSIRAFDLYEHRVELIRKEAARLGHGIVTAQAADSCEFMPEWEGKADRVLADVPCSGLGTLRQNPEIKLKEIPKIESQAKILENAYRYLKKGGVLVYSTCTINPEENQEIVKGYDVEKQIQLFTRKNGPDGFFICRIRRK